MKQVTMRHTFNCDVDTFWKLFLDDDYNHKVFVDDLRYKEHRVLDRREDDDKITRRVVVQPEMDAPGPVKKLMGDSFKLTEEGTFDKKSKTYRFKAIPSAMSDKVTISGTMRAESAGENRTTRIVELSMEAKVFGLGGLIESTGATNSEKGYADYASAVNKRLAAAK